MRVWNFCGNLWAYGLRVCRLQRRDFVGPQWMHVQFPWELRARLWLAVRLKRLTCWVLDESVPDPFDEEGPHYVVAWVEVDEDGDEGS